MATEIDRFGVVDGYGGASLHERSHGEPFLDLTIYRFKPQSLYLLDEPEAARILQIDSDGAIRDVDYDEVSAGTADPLVSGQPAALPAPPVSGRRPTWACVMVSPACEARGCQRLGEVAAVEESPRRTSAPAAPGHDCFAVTSSRSAVFNNVGLDLLGESFGGGELLA
ncbi:hypothetical protein [Micromonospora ureilytica]|uniref:hypothetical protein n=1 Tax=Micromonospora ureilytica TaxID=709868 RepID=UPI0040394C9E